MVKYDMEYVEWEFDYFCYSIRSFNGYYVLEIIYVKILLL